MWRWDENEHACKGDKIIMEKLTIAEAKRLNDTMVTEDHLKLHAANVAACMG